MDRWRAELDSLREQNMLRSLRTVEGAQAPRVRVEGQDCLLLCSNNYLGLAAHPALTLAACEATRRFGTGSGASRLVSGSMSLHRQLEERIAAFKGTQRALLFNSGYAANTGILQGLFGPGDLIFSDALNHASIVDGCRLSRARVRIYPHGDLAALEAMMIEEDAKRESGRWLIVTDGVFSMDGDLAPLPGLAALKKKYGALLMVDDAHGTAVLGKTGRGTAELLGCLDRVDLHMGTLGKALGGFGAYLAACETLVEVLVNRARSFIFSTSLPPGVLGAALAALDLVESLEGARRRDDLERNRRLFTRRLEKGGTDLLGSRTQIVPVLTRTPALTMEAGRRLLERGIFLQGIRPPTVPEGLCRLRATLMSDHEPAELEAAADAILEILEALR